MNKKHNMNKQTQTWYTAKIRLRYIYKGHVWVLAQSPASEKARLHKNISTQTDAKWNYLVSRVMNWPGLRFNIKTVFPGMGFPLQIESIKTTSMEDVSTKVLENKLRIFKKVKPKNNLMYQDIYSCICQNTKK